MTLRRRLRLLRRFFQLSWGERFALVRALALLLVARAALAVLPLRTVLSMASRPPRGSPKARADDALQFMCWAVEAAGNRLFPRNPCLTQAIVIQRLFARSGRPAELRIGVHREHPSHLKAHAWVESAGVIVMGEKGLTEDYIPLPPIRSKPAG